TLARGVNGSRDELLTGAGLTEQQYSGIGRGHCCDLAQDAFQRPAFANDLSEMLGAADLFLEVDILVREPILERGNLAKRQRILDRNGDLCSRLRAPVHLVGRERSR